MTSPPPAAPQGRPGRHARRGRAGVTRIVQTNELPPGVDALASADGKTIIVRASLDQVGMRQAVREVMASLRGFSRLALYPAISLEAVRHALRRLAAAVAEAGQAIQQFSAAAGEHVTGLAVAVTATAGTVAVVTAVVATANPDAGAGAAPAPGAGRGQAAAPGNGANPVARASLPARPLSYLGVYTDGVPASFSQVSQFAITVGVRPNIALYYSSFFEQFKSAFAEQAYADGATVAVQIEPFGVSLAAVAAGTYDRSLAVFARQVRDFGHAVIIGFGHEPNGAWYPWGAAVVTPDIWIAAWRHVVDLFRTAGADNVIWLWTVNSQGPYATLAGAWWPGPAYVTWVGLDGYYQRRGDTFGRLFAAELNVVTGLGKPIIISETAVGPGTGNQIAGIHNLFTGLRSARLLGLIWFDKAQDHGQYRQNWRIEGHPALIRAFGAAGGYLSS